MRSKGFTLIEVMVALAIVAALLTTLLYTVSFHLDMAGRHETITRAVLLGREKLNTLSTGGTSDTGTQDAEGSFKAPNEDFKWRVDVSETEYDDVFEVSVTVTSGREKVVLKELLREGAFK